MPVYRGPGGAGDATNDATVTAVQAAAASAATSATNAANSATAAANSATGAATSATNAANSATTAAGQATTAAGSATNAATFATNSSLSADDAADSALEAQQYASEAFNYSTAASLSAGNASTSASAAQVSQLAAETAAIAVEGITTDPDFITVLGLSDELQTVSANTANINAVAANNTNITAVAGNSTNINTVAAAVTPITTVSNNDANVRTVATNIASVNTNATNIVAIQNASTNATNAANSASAAAASAASAAASFDAFDDIYLGAKASNPTVDNDGNALTTGDQYFNTVSNELRVWNGSTWQAASVIGGTVNSLNVTGVSTFSAGTVSAPAITTTGDTNTGIFFPTADTIAFTEGGVEAMRITSVGEVGIGTATPSVYSLSFARQFTVSTTTASGFAVGTFAGGSGGSGGIEFGNQTVRQAAIYGLDGSALALYTNATNSGSGLTERMRIDSSGNVGIGATPTVTSGYTTLQVSGASGGLFRFSGSTAIQLYGGSDTASGFIGTSTNHPFVFYSNATERMRITSAGDVGIGVTSPLYKIDVTRGNIAGVQPVARFGVTGNGGSGRGASIIIGSGGSGSSIVDVAQIVGYQLTASATANNAALAFQVADSSGVLTERMYINNAGNVGIGTSSPTWLLSLSKSSASGSVGLYPAIQINNANASGYSALYLNDGSAQAGLETQRNTAHLGLSAGGAERMRIDSAGNVGIGTISPSSKLQVAGSGDIFRIAASSAGVAQFLSFSTSAAVRRGYFGYGGGGTTSLQLINEESGTLEFGTNGAERMRIDSSGNVLIGTTSTLSVAAVSSTFTQKNNLSSWTGYFQNTNATPFGAVVQHTTDVNGAGNGFFYAYGNTTARFYVSSNGGVNNFSANNTNLSDARTKKDIQNAGNYLDKICAIPVRTFLYNDQTDTDLNLGVIAQEVEAVAPEFVSNAGFGKIKEGEEPLKAIYTTDIMFGLMKAIQELKAEFDAYKATHP